MCKLCRVHVGGEFPGTDFGMIIHFDCKNCDEPVEDHCASCYACFDGDMGHGLDCPQVRESIDYDQLMIDQGIIPNDMLDY